MDEGETAAAAAATGGVLLRTAKLGTCASLEKEYLRLTSLPSAASVRPPNILALALALVRGSGEGGR